MRTSFPNRRAAMDLPGGPARQSAARVERKDGSAGESSTPRRLWPRRMCSARFFEVRFDPQTGAIRTISDYHSRNPRLAQQIALRLPRARAGKDMNYSIWRRRTE